MIRTMETPEHSPEPVATLCEGDVDPGLKKQVRFLIARRTDFIVYLDTDCAVQWRLPYKSVESTSPHAHEILNEVSLVETLSIPLKKTEHLEPVRRLLGEAVARLFSGGQTSEAAALKLLADARVYLQNRMAEMARIWYLSAAGLFAMIAVGGMVVAWLNRAFLSSLFTPSAIEVVLCSGFGAVGAFMSLLTRSANIRVAAGAGRKIHYVEALSRVAAGAVGAVFVSLAVKANLLLGALNAPDSDSTLLYLLCLVSGASERLVPGLIARVEASANGSRLPAPDESLTDAEKGV
jgi:hypothetical protein